MRRFRAAVVVLTVVLVAGACSGSKHAGKPTPTTARPASATGAPATEADLRAAIRTEGLTPERATALFALDVAPLPGVSVAGIKPDDINFDGTDAVSYLYAEWSHLTTAQQDAATQTLAPARTLKSATTHAARTAAPQAATLLAARTSLRRADAPTIDYLGLAQQADTEEATQLGVPAIGAFVIDISEDMTKTYAETHYFDPPIQIGQRTFGGWGDYSDGCHITVWEKRWAGTDAESAAAILAHEVFHCYQQRSAGMGKDNVPNYLGIHDWIGEGEATWVMEQLHPGAAVVNDIWSKYAFTPTTKYVDRSYDGIGIYGHYGDVAGSQDTLWPLLLPVSNAGIGGEDSAAFSKLLNSTTERYYSSWGASYYEDQGHIDWHMAGPGTPPAAGPSPKSVTVNAQDAEDIGSVGPYQAEQTTIQSTADVLVVTLASGYGKAHDQNYTVDQTLDTTAPLALCLNQNGCRCPDGSAGASEHTIKATAPISVGMDGGDQQVAAYAAGASLDDFCKKPNLPPPSGGGAPPSQPGGGGGGGGEPDQPQPQGVTRGDPHLTTFAGTPYDLQTVGEMTLVKSTTDDFTVQVRTAPVAGSTSAALNTTIATSLGGHKLQIGQENGAVQAREDGKLVIDEVTKIGTGSLQRLLTAAGQGFVVTWPDGTTVRVGPYTLVGIDVTVAPAKERKGKLVGLLGNDDGQPGNDRATADGHSIGAVPTRAVLNTTYTNSWRVTPATSLFTYPPGQSTAAFTDPAFPRANVDARNAPDRANVEQQCRAEGVTDPYLLQDCIVDASAIHGHAVLNNYAHAQIVQSVRSNLARGLPAFSAAPAGTATGGASTTTTMTVAASGSTLRTIIDVGRVNDAQETVPFAFPAHAGDVIWIGAPQCDDGGLEFALVDPNGKTLDQNDVDMGLPVCQAGRFDLATDGTYQLVANADHQRAGNYSVPIRFQRRDVVAHAAYGQPLSGDIPQTAAHDVYTFDAQAGDVVHIFGPGCDIGQDNREMTLGFRKADGTPSGGILDCTQGTQNLIHDTGTYEIVVNFANRGPGRYSFVLQK